MKPLGIDKGDYFTRVTIVWRGEASRFTQLEKIDVSLPGMLRPYGIRNGFWMTRVKNKQIVIG